MARKINLEDGMEKEYICPKCQKELKEKDIVRGSCPHCYAIFDTPIVKEISDERKRELNSAVLHLTEANEQREKSFGGSLFDFTFTHFITLKVIRWTYGLAIFFAGIVALGILILGCSGALSRELGVNKGLSVFLSLILAPIAFFIIIFFERLWLELIAVIFRANNHLSTLVKLTEEKFRKEKS